MVLLAAAITLISLGWAAASERHQICFSCKSSTANSPCHLEPPRKGDSTERCGERPSHCVIDRLQNEDGTFVSIERRCSTRDETKAAHNKCVKTDSDLQRCLTLCYGDFCNSGTGQLIEDDGSWDYDDPDYSDNIYDPHDAVLANRKRPYSGPFPVGTAEFPVVKKVTPEELKVTKEELESGVVAGALAGVAAGSGAVVRGEVLWSLLLTAMVVLWWR